MLSRPLLCLTALAAALLTAPSPGFAQFKVCNRTSAKEIYVALGLYRGRKGWESEGWYSIERGQCSQLIDKMADRYYYLYVVSENSETVWDGKGDAGSTNFCVKDDDDEFTLNVAAMSRGSDNPDCEKHRATTKRFFRVDTERYGDYTYSLSD